MQRRPLDRFSSVNFNSLCRENVPPILNQASQPVGEGVPEISVTTMVGREAQPIAIIATTMAPRSVGTRIDDLCLPNVGDEPRRVSATAFSAVGSIALLAGARSRFRLTGLSPLIGGETPYSLKIRFAHVQLRSAPALQRVKDLLGQHRADRMHCLVPSQSFRPKPRERFDNHTLTERNLILDHQMDRGVQSCPRELNPVMPMVRLHSCHSFGFIHGQPLARLGAFFRIVGRHHISVGCKQG
jgi:hypothetical protein